MHKESYEVMKYFVNTYLDPKCVLDVLDIGSYDVNGSYRELFQKDQWTYTGMDIEMGPNVDIVSKAPYDFGIDKQFDVVISGNCIEHVKAPWEWIKEVEKVVKPEGLLCIVTPFNLPEHRYPVDCWRVLPDGFRYLLCEQTNFEVLENRITAPLQIIRFFDRKPKLKPLYKILPIRIKKLLYKSPITDTYVIAKKMR